MTEVGAAPAIKVQGLGKSYRIGATGYRPTSIVEAVTAKLRTPRTPSRRSHTNFEALDDVTFEIAAGEAVGIVGRNGRASRRCSSSSPRSPPRPAVASSSRAEWVRCSRWAPVSTVS